MDEQSHRRYETPGMRHEGLPIHQGHTFLEVASVCLLLCGGAGHWQHLKSTQRQGCIEELETGTNWNKVGLASSRNYFIFKRNTHWFSTVEQ